MIICSGNILVLEIWPSSDLDRLFYIPRLGELQERARVEETSTADLLGVPGHDAVRAPDVDAGTLNLVRLAYSVSETGVRSYSSSLPVAEDFLCVAAQMLQTWHLRPLVEDPDTVLFHVGHIPPPPTSGVSGPLSHSQPPGLARQGRQDSARPQPPMHPDRPRAGPDVLARSTAAIHALDSRTIALPSN
ncbi:hypothetical protein PG995_015482 [Apiospora arundinis]